VLHANAARLAAYYGAPHLAAALAAVASDDERHAAGFAAAAGQLFRADPAGALSALDAIAAAGVPLRGGSMDDGWHEAGNAHHAAQGQLGGGGDESGGSGGETGCGGGTTGLFRDWAAVLDAAGVFTVADYAAGLEEAAAAWNVRGAGRGAWGIGDGEGKWEARAAAGSPPRGGRPRQPRPPALCLFSARPPPPAPAGRVVARRRPRRGRGAGAPRVAARRGAPPRRAAAGAAARGPAARRGAQCGVLVGPLPPGAAELRGPRPRCYWHCPGPRGPPATKMQQ
jgi:hypothetical protein